MPTTGTFSVPIDNASPTEPIDCAMPASRQSFPNASDVYCEPWSE